MRNLWQMWEGVLPTETVEDIIKRGQEQQIKDAEIFSNNNADNSVRSSKISWLTGEQDILNLLFDYVDQANQLAFSVDVWRNAEIQYTEYRAEENGHYTWHHDVHWNTDKTSSRKISVTVQLSDPPEYAGGEFEFQGIENPGPESRTKGTVLAFPSYLEHRVKPVTAGTRKSLVAWFEGPHWR